MSLHIPYAVMWTLSAIEILKQSVLLYKHTPNLLFLSLKFGIKMILLCEKIFGVFGRLPVSHLSGRSVAGRLFLATWYFSST